ITEYPKGREVQVQIPQCPNDRSKPAVDPSLAELKSWKSMIVAGVIALAFFPASSGGGQQGAALSPPKPIVIPNRTLDSHELNELAERNLRRRNYEAANVERKRVIDEETEKLVILARDLKAKTENLGNAQLTPTMVREAEVIELLANDVKQKMKLTINAD
ncbi:MAG: hypothetical protein WA815_14580, partial [Terracidiphilus sp.]